ncbi:hypothetical protein EDD16DRAFT_446437 [Pisolithus croceorrhizus]|nr:hypothetical protein EDD16DRAFT_446437 [Pisolithus croceorrhizus]KAI6107494.1 hypothetical protein EV401DRAFT_440437 [Pisolithus croceorrhizus]KAI6165554.1 hypothetical protein EDD17DRAFT_172967 [Pisolithus thermaeus]
MKNRVELLGQATEPMRACLLTYASIRSLWASHWFTLLVQRSFRLGTVLYCIVGSLLISSPPVVILLFWDMSHTLGLRSPLFASNRSIKHVDDRSLRTYFVNAPTCRRCQVQVRGIARLNSPLNDQCELLRHLCMAQKKVYCQLLRDLSLVSHSWRSSAQSKYARVAKSAIDLYFLVRYR